MKNYKDYIKKIFETHLVLAGMDSIKHSATNKFEQAITKNLLQISLHAGEKRIMQGEIYQPINLLALLQYEFMLKKMLPYVTNNEIKTVMEIAIEKICSVADEIGIPHFESKDEILIVEVSADENNYKALTIEQFEKWKGDFNRMLPINPNCLQMLATKDMGGFMNYNGYEEPAVDWIMNNFENPTDFIPIENDQI